MDNKDIKVLIVKAPGTNCDEETSRSFLSFGVKVDKINIKKIVSNEINLCSYQILVFPGGFSFGDDISAGKVLANEIIYKIKDSLYNFVKSKRLVLGICNGFQVLVKTGLLPGIDEIFDNVQYSTLINNDSGKFECSWGYLKKNDKNKSPFLKYVPDVIEIPWAHGEGKFLTNDNILKKIEDLELIAFQYSDNIGNISDKYPICPNGSIKAIAGITNKLGNVLGMMPHPERAFKKYQAKNWTDQKSKNKDFDPENYADGFFIFKGAIEYIKESF